MTALNKTLKRSLTINGIDYVMTLSPETLKLTHKVHGLPTDAPQTDWLKFFGAPNISKILLEPIP